MSLRSSNLSAADAYQKIKTQAGATKQYLTQRRTEFQGVTSSLSAVSTVQHLGQVIGLFTAWAAVPGIAVYAQSQENDPTYDVVAEFTTMKNAMSSCLAQLIAMFPKDANGFLLYQTFNADGSVSYRTFTAAQLSAVVTLIDGVIATIV